MGERDLSAGAIAGPRHQLRPWLVPAALLLLLTVLSLARPLAPPAAPRAAAQGLGAASLARDLDLRFTAADAERWTDFVRPGSAGVLLARASSETGASFPGDVLSLAYLAPFAGLAGLRGILFAYALALAFALGLAAATLRQRVETPWRLLMLCLFASVVLPFVLEPRAEVLVLAAVVAAFALAYGQETARFEELPEVFGGESRGARAAGRWLVIGALLGYALLAHPIYVALFLPALAAIPRRHRPAGATALALGAVATVGLAVIAGLALGGPLPWLAELGLFTRDGGVAGGGGAWSDGMPVPSVTESLRLVPDLSLLGWNLLFLIAGRTLGALPYFLPVLVLIALWEPRAGRSVLVATAAGCALLTVVLWPFDWAGGAAGLGNAGLGNAVLLPIYGALWLVPTRRCVWVAPVAAAILAGLVLWPSWLAAFGLWTGAASSTAPIAPLASRWLPHESTLRPLGGDSVSAGVLRVLPAGGAVEHRRGGLFLEGGRWGNLVVASPRPLTAIRLVFDGQAGSELEVIGGALGDTVFRADGGVEFEVGLAGRARRHPMWFSAEPRSLYDLRLRLPRAPRIPVAFNLEEVPSAD